MITITKGRLLTIKQWRETYGPGSNVVLPAEEAEELARIALASLEAKPIAWECGENIILFNPDTVEAYAKRAEVSPKPLYAAPPVPVTPDGWISCSEQMPPQDDWILIYSKHGEYMAGQVQGEYVELSDGTLSWLGNALFWMPLPEPPQEAK